MFTIRPATKPNYCHLPPCSLKDWSDQNTDGPLSTRLPVQYGWASAKRPRRADGEGECSSKTLPPPPLCEQLVPNSKQKPYLLAVVQSSVGPASFTVTRVVCDAKCVCGDVGDVFGWSSLKAIKNAEILPPFSTVTKWVRPFHHRELIADRPKPVWFRKHGLRQ